MDVVRDLDLTDVLADHRQQRATRLAMVDGRNRLTYGDMADRVQALATAFRALGLGEGDRLLWLGGDSFRLLECLLAAARLGGVVCPVTGRRSAAELRHLLADCEPSVVLCGGEHLAALDAAGGVPRVRHDVTDGYEALLRSYWGSTAEFELVTGSAPVLMLYTPMVAGHSVGVQVSRSALLAESVAVALRSNTEPARRPVVIRGMDHVVSMVVALAAILVGTRIDVSTSSPVLLPAEDQDISTVVELPRRHIRRS